MNEQILVVDDDSGVTTLLTEVFGVCGYRVTCTCNGIEALAVLKDNPTFNLVLTDLNMPFLDGLQLYEIIADLYPFMTVLIMTGGSSKGTIIPTNLEIIRKPFSLEVVKGTIQKSITAQNVQEEKNK